MVGSISKPPQYNPKNKGEIPNPNLEWGVWKLVAGTPIESEEPSQSETETSVETEESSEPETTVEPTEPEETEEPSEPETTVDSEDPKLPVDVDTSRLLIGYWHTWGGGAIYRNPDFGRRLSTG